ncbi:MAG: exopolygalacturonase [Clostridia bacterium]|nr:exopolygalacturonase [Clostridia bacterium]
MKKTLDCFPDGTPMSDWFSDKRTPDITDLGRQYYITDAGAVCDGTPQTDIIQGLIDRAAGEGGGVIVVPSGTFVTGALFFRPGVDLYIEEGGCLMGSDDISDYPPMKTRIEGETCAYFPALINADRCDGFTACGKGTIDGNGLRSWKAFWLRRKWNPSCTNKDEQRARLIYISESENVTVSGLRLQNSQFWTCHFYRCRFVRVTGCSIFSPFEPVKAPSTDAIDLDVCSDVVIRDCDMHVNDDAVALKGGKGLNADLLPENGPNERILVEDCRYGFCHGCLTLGSEAVGVRNVILRRIRVDSGYHMLWLKMRPDTPQKYEYILCEDISGRVENAFCLLPWTQFCDLRGGKPAMSYASHIRVQRCRLECGTCYETRRSDGEYRLEDIFFDESFISAGQRGEPFWEDSM